MSAQEYPMSDAERAAAAERNADAHYTRLHLAHHDPRVPYRECPDCLARGWR